MEIRNLDNLLQELEQGATDELDFLWQTGAEYYSTAQLWRLRGQWEIKNDLFRRFQRLLLGIAAASPVWLLLSVGFLLMDVPRLATFCLLMFPITYFLFLMGQIFMRRYFKGRGHLEAVGAAIVAELRQRETDSSPQG